MRSVKPIQDRIRYTIASSVNHTEYQPDEASTAKRQGLLLPEGYNPLTVQWAQRLRQTTADPLQLTQLVLNFFRQQPFRYTFNPPLLGMNQIDDFMFGTQAGFCEHYASAFVVAMRAMGVPARVVTGYQGGELNSVDGLMTVRQSDAHAWAEIWINQRGWLRIDPTAAVAPARVEHKGSAVLNGTGLINFNQQTWLLNLTKQLRSRWDATNSAWNLWALNYNLEKQKNLLSNLAGIQNPQATQIGVAMMLAASLVVAVISLLLLSQPARLSPLDKMYQRFCQAMSNRGYPRMLHEGAIAYNQRLQDVFHNPAIDKFLTLYTQFKYAKNTEPNHLIILKNQLKLCLQLKP